MIDISKNADLKRKAYKHDLVLVYLATLAVCDIANSLAVYVQLAPGSGKSFVILLIANYLISQGKATDVFVVLPDAVLKH